jgi:hypothetical protein
MERALVTRGVLARALAVNAATRPFNVAVAASVVAAACILSVWLLPIAVFVYGALVLTTLVDGDAAEKVGRTVYAKARPREARAPALEPAAVQDAAVARKVALAHYAEQRIREAISDSSAALPDVEAELERLLQGLEALARQADRVSSYLTGDDEGELWRRLATLRGSQSGDQQLDRANAQAAAALQDQLDARGQLAAQLSRLDAQMDHILATLGVVHAQIIRMNVAEERFVQDRVADQVRGLRLEVGAAADALDEAYRDLG